MAQLQQCRTPLLPRPDHHSLDCRGFKHLPNGKCRDTSPTVVLDILPAPSETARLNPQPTADQDEICEVSISGDSSESRSSDRELNRLYSFLGDEPDIGPMPPVDPFRNHTEQIGSLYEWAKVLLCLPLAIVRLTLAILTTLIGLLIAKAILLGWTQKQTPMPRWRRKLLYITRLLARFILFCFGYHWIRRLGKPSKREVAPIVVSNHVSYIDPIFFFYELFPSFVSSASHSNIPGIGAIIRPMQVINVDRSSADSKRDAVKEINNRAQCNEFPHVMLFPEGTTTNGKALIFFQLGAFMPGLPVQPVILRYPFVHFDNSWGNISILKLLFRMLTQFHNFIEIEYLPVIFPSQREKDHAAFFAKKVKNVMARAMNVAETNHSYGDLILSTKASELNLSPTSAYMVEMATMEKLFHISTHEAKDFLEKFGAMYPSNSGCVTEDQFLEALELPRTMFSKKIFGFFEKEDEGCITFREFLAGSAFILKHPSFGRLSRAAFDSCDFQKKGFLSYSEVERSLRLVFPDISELQVQRMMTKLDMDGDDSVSWDDFRMFMEKYPELLGVFLTPSCWE